MAQWQTLSDRINTVAPSATLAVDSKAKAMKAAGLDVVGFGAGEPNFPTPANVVKAAADACLDPKNYKYTPTPGLPELREAIAAKMLRDSGYEVNADQVVVTNGGKQAVYESFQILLNDGDEVIIPAPYWTSYPEAVKLAGGVPVEVFAGADVNFEPSLEALEAARTEHTKAIIVNSPNNPTGATITKDQLQKWVDYANEKHAVIIYDAAYEAYISEPDVPHTIYECDGAKTCAIELRSFSKNAGFTGTRLGFTVIPKELKSADGVALNPLWARRHGTKYNGAPYIVQAAGEAVYSEAGKKQTGEQIAYYMKNAKYIFDGLKSAGYSVSGGVNAPYIWLKTPDGMSSWEFFDYLLEKANVVGTPGSGFGPSGEGYFRLTAFGTYENTVKAIDRMKAL